MKLLSSSHLPQPQTSATISLMADSLSLDQTRKIAHLARLDLSDQDLEKYASQLSHVLEHIDQLSQLDTTGVAQTAQVTGLENITRPDQTGARTLDAPTAVNQAVQSHDHYVVVPEILTNRASGD